MIKKTSVSLFTDGPLCLAVAAYHAFVQKPSLVSDTVADTSGCGVEKTFWLIQNVLY
jgi:hypothetical protein